MRLCVQYFKIIIKFITPDVIPCLLPVVSHTFLYVFFFNVYVCVVCMCVLKGMDFFLSEITQIGRAQCEYKCSARR